MKIRGSLNESYFLQTSFHQAYEPEHVKEAVKRQTQILEADYSKIDIPSYVEEIPHLNEEEKEQLTETLSDFPTLFGGGLGTLNIPPVHLEVAPDAVPYHAKAFPVPQAYLDLTKKEVERLCSIGVLVEDYDSEWAAPTFIQMKKTGDVRILTDFRRLNKVLVRKPFPLPKIADLLHGLEGFKYATALDLSMGYYHVPLDEASQKLCSTIFPWAKYKYLRLPMGISNAPDIFQAIMQKLIGHLPFVRVYIDDSLIITVTNYKDHLKHTSQVLQILQDAGFRANLKKCTFACGELDYLGYSLTRQGIQPQPKKVEAIMRLNIPQNQRELRTFLGLVNYYRDMWPRRSHILAPLSELSSTKKKWEWTQEHTEAFEEAKRAISKEALLAYPDFN
jgi:hypothetical protein